MNEQPADEQHDDPLPAAGDPGPAGTDESDAEISSAELLRGRREILIRHGDDLYRLRLTRNGKLILQK